MADIANKFGLGGSVFPLSTGTAESDTILMGYVGEQGLSLGSIQANRLYAIPFFVSENTSIDGLAIENTGTGDSGDDLRLGLYNSTTAGLPGALIDETGEIALDANRDVRVAAMGGSQALSPNEKYFLAVVANATIALLSASITADVGVSVGYTRLGLNAWGSGFPIYNGTDYRICSYASHTYGALPDPFGSIVGQDRMPLMGARVS